MTIEEFVADILKRKASATNKDLMGALVDETLDALKKLNAASPDERFEQLKQSHHKVLAAKDDQIVDLQKQLTEAQEEALNAIAKVNEAPASPGNKITAKLDGQKYEILFGVNFEGVNYTANDIAENKQVLASLIEIKSGAVSKVEG